MRIAVREARQTRLERRFAGEAPVRGELGFGPPEAVVEQGHRIERAVGVVGVELDQLEANVAVHSREVLEARLAAPRAVARLLREGERIFHLLADQTAEQAPAARHFALAGG